MTTTILAALLGCTTRIHAVSTSATNEVQIVRGGSMPTEHRIEGTTIAHGRGEAVGRSTYVVGRRFWAVATDDEGAVSVVRIRQEAKPGPIAGCAVGASCCGRRPSAACTCPAPRRTSLRSPALPNDQHPGVRIPPGVVH